MYKDLWTKEDFQEMSWHDNRLYGLFFLKEEFSFALEIDYIFEAHLNEHKGLYDKFLIAPAELKFANYFDLEIEIAWGETYDVIINEIRRRPDVQTSGSGIKIDEYIVLLENGKIQFKATDYKMKLKAKPIWSDTLDFGLSRRKKVLSQS